MRIIYLAIIMCLTAQSAYADNIYTFMQFDCDESSNRLEIKKVYTADYDLKSLDKVPGVIKDLGIEYIRNEHGRTIVKTGQLPKVVGSCSLSNLKNEKIEITLSLTEIHSARVRGLCAAASGPAYEVLLSNKAIARFPSKKDRCYPKLNPLDITRMEYSRGVASLCRVPDNSSSNIQNLTVRWEGELCLDGTPEEIINNQDVIKDFQKELYDNIALDEAHRELHIYRNRDASSAQSGQANQESLKQLKATHKNQQEEIVQLEKELKETKSKLTTEQSKTFWQKLFD